MCAFSMCTHYLFLRYAHQEDGDRCTSDDSGDEGARNDTSISAGLASGESASDDDASDDGVDGDGASDGGGASGGGGTRSGAAKVT
jgi:hypothetical protein